MYRQQYPSHQNSSKIPLLRQRDLLLAANAPLTLHNCLGDLIKASRSGGKETEESPAGAQDPTEVLGMELHTHKPGVVLDLDDLHTLTLDVLSNEGETGLLDLLDHLRVDLVTMAVALLNLRDGGSVQTPQTRPLGVLLEDAGVSAKTHGSTELALVDLGHVDNGVVLGLGVQLLTADILDVGDVAAELQHGQLHTQADTQERLVVGTRPCDGLHHTLSTSVTETTGHQDTIGRADRVPGLVVIGRGGGVIFQMRRVDPDDLNLLVAVHGRVLQSLGDTDVGIVKGSVFANQGNGDGIVEEVLATSKIAPVVPHAAALLLALRGLRDRLQVEHIGDGANKLLLLEEHRHVVCRRDVVNGNDLVLLDGAHVGDLLDGAIFQRLLAATSNQVGVETSTPHIADCPLRGFRLLLTTRSRRDDRHVGDVDLDKVALARLSLELAQSVDERGTLNVTDGTTQLDDADIRLGLGLVDGDLGYPLNPLLNGIGDVGHDLHGLTKIMANALAVDDVLVDLSGGDVVIAGERGEEVALVVAKVEVHFTAVVCDIDLTVPSIVGVMSIRCVSPRSRKPRRY